MLGLPPPMSAFDVSKPPIHFPPPIYFLLCLEQERSRAPLPAREAQPAKSLAYRPINKDTIVIYGIYRPKESLGI